MYVPIKIVLQVDAEGSAIGKVRLQQYWPEIKIHTYE